MFIRKKDWELLLSKLDTIISNQDLEKSKREESSLPIEEIHIEEHTDEPKETLKIASCSCRNCKWGVGGLPLHKKCITCFKHPETGVLELTNWESNEI